MLDNKYIDQRFSQENLFPSSVPIPQLGNRKFWKMLQSDLISYVAQ